LCALGPLGLRGQLVVVARRPRRGVAAKRAAMASLKAGAGPDGGLVGRHGPGTWTILRRMGAVLARARSGPVSVAAVL
jgi:hypothetical protein